MFSETWFHGTDTHFENWLFPPPRFKRELAHHSAIFLTTDLWLASYCGKRICSARILPDAKILDLLRPSENTERLRAAIATTPRGRQNVYVQNPELWRTACIDGQIMRYATMNPETIRQIVYHTELATVLKNALKIGAVPPAGALDSWLYLQNSTRTWIEVFARSASDLGFDGLIANEFQSEHPFGPRPSRILFALNDKAISSPKWLAVP